MNYHDALNFIYSLTNFEVTPAGVYSSKTFDLSRMNVLLDALGNPQKRYQSVHVAGTKGKGSTAAMIERVLRASGYSTGFFTSPHLHTFRERIRVDGDLIPESKLVAQMEKLRPIAEKIPSLTAFEVMTALALDYFATREVDLAVLEVGLGGRLDATNVVTPLVSVITSISLDHVGILGNTVAQIASEKAGIIKPGVPCVTSPQTSEALSVIKQTAEQKQSRLTVVGQDLRFHVAGTQYQIVQTGQDLQGQSFLVHIRSDSETFTVSCRIPLLGPHQLANASTALAAITVLKSEGIVISDKEIVIGLADVSWPGRFEVLDRSPLLIVDGAHNADSAYHLRITLQELKYKGKLHLVLGTSGDKDIAGIFAELLPFASTVTLTRSKNPRAADPSELAKLAVPFGKEITIAPDVGEALRRTRSIASPQDVICVTGSLFVVAEARAAWLGEHGQAMEHD